MSQGGWGHGGGPPSAPGGYGPPPSGYGGYGAPQPIVHQHPHAGLMWTCRSCGYAGVPRHTDKTSTAGWLVFLLSGVTCVGLLVGWIALFTMKTRTTTCPACHTVAGSG